MKQLTLGWGRRFTEAPWCYGTLVVLAAGVYVRLFFGVDCLDEALYVALPYTFALGNGPFVDETGIGQTLAILMQHPIRLFLLLSGSSNGIVLFVRHLYFAFSLVTCGVATVFLKKRVPLPLAALPASLILTFMPYSIPSLSYNTAGVLGFTCGSFLMGTAAIAVHPVRLLFLGTLFHAAAVLAYPPLALAAAFSGASGLYLIAASGRRLRGPVLACTLGASLVAVYVAWVLSRAGMENLGRTFEYMRSFSLPWQPRSVARLEWILQGLGARWRFIGGLGLVVLSSLAIARRAPRFALAATVVLPLLCLSNFVEDTSIPLWKDGHPPHLMLVALGLMPAILLPLLAVVERLPWRALAPEIAIWLSSCCAGLMVAWVSSNGFPNAQLGFVPAAVLAAMLILRVGAAGDRAGDSTSGRSPAPLAACLVVSLALVQLVNDFRYVYLDDPIPRLTTRLSDGPFEGLRTTPAKADFITKLGADIRSLAARHSSILFFDDFPAGYLFSDLKAATPAVWMLGNWTQFSSYDRSIFSRYYARRDRLPDVAVHVVKVPFTSEFTFPVPPWERDPVVALFEPPVYEEVLRRPEYTVSARTAHDGGRGGGR